nr:MAG TPA: hypothetical protein [Caudoviricetes sp.]
MSCKVTSIDKRKDALRVFSYINDDFMVSCQLKSFDVPSFNLIGKEDFTCCRVDIAAAAVVFIIRIVIRPFSPRFIVIDEFRVSIRDIVAEVS